MCTHRLLRELLGIPTTYSKFGRAHNSSLFLLLFVMSLGVAHSAAQGTPTGPVPLSYGGIMYSNPLSDIPTNGSPGGYVDRLWDDGASWPVFETGNSVWNTTSFQNLDTILEDDYNNGISEGAPGTPLAWMTLNRTPNWALAGNGTCSTNPYQPACDPNCNYYNPNSPTGKGAPGQCYAPSLLTGTPANPDVGVDGSGLDSIWKAWVTKIANHANGLDGNPNYIAPGCVNAHVTCHAHIHYWEIWNEIDDTGSGNDGIHNYNNIGGYISNNLTANGVFFIGTYAQLVRLAEDAACIIKGKNFIATIHNDPTPGATTACTASGIDPSAEIVMPSVHAYVPFGPNTAQNFLYCTGDSYTGPGKVTTGAPEYCNMSPGGNWGAKAISDINVHMKPGNAMAPPNGDGLNGFNVEAEMTNEYCRVIGYTNTSECANYTNYPGVLQSAELKKPFYNGEAGYSGAVGNGWKGNDGGQSLDISNNDNYMASFTARYILMMWSLGITNFEWYQYDGGNFINTSNGGFFGYNSVVDEMAHIGLTMTTPCHNVVNTQWMCGFTDSHGVSNQFLWDTDYTTYSCPTGTTYGVGCGTHMVSVPTTYANYQNVWGGGFQIPTTGQNAHMVPVGVIPIWVLQNPEF